jgi:hypothetical protein
MAGKRKTRGSADRVLIALTQPHEVRSWCRKFKVTPAKLKAAVKEVGRSARKVGAYLKLQKLKKGDRALIALKQDYEVRYWSRRFKVTPARLRAAVKEVGRSSSKVGLYLMGAKKTKKRAAKRK